MEYSVYWNKIETIDTGNIPLMHISHTPKPDIGQTIRQFRRQKGLTGEQLGQKANISQSKISKMETGALLPKLSEMELLLNILEVPQTIRQQIIASLTISSPKQSFRSLPISLNEIFNREKRAQSIVGFTANLPPALFQTLSYHENMLKTLGVPQEEMSTRLKTLCDRQEQLWNPQRTCHFIILETALYTRFTSVQMHLAQLDRLERLSGFRGLQCSIIPLECGLLPVETTNFALYDHRLAAMITNYYEFLYHDPEHVSEYIKIFTELDQKSCKGNEAIELIDKARRYFI